MYTKHISGTCMYINFRKYCVRTFLYLCGKWAAFEECTVPTYTYVTGVDVVNCVVPRYMCVAFGSSFIDSNCLALSTLVHGLVLCNVGYANMPQKSLLLVVCKKVPTSLQPCKIVE